MSPKNVGFGEAIKLYFSNYVNFNGRSTKSEFWWVVLFNLIVGFVLSFVAKSTGIVFLPLLWSLATLLPGLGLSIRRMHDTGRSGWWILICLIPIIGAIIFIIYAIADSDGANAWGEAAK